ncbi:MAG: Mov34/MPN/PAD-1 family protein [Candidatus Methanomethylicaceae archaeon]|nr:Mov34/MPN/PAD-1 family protein [Candidatus Verstraetearchaeota archaeon]
MIEKVIVNREALKVFLNFCKCFHPRENIMLIRGKIKNKIAEVKEFLIPPFSNYGEGFSSLPLFTLPLDFSIIGIAHSHPSGDASPSLEDLNNFYGKIMIITSYPYNDISVYDSKAKKIPFEIIKL